MCIMCGVSTLHHVYNVHIIHIIMCIMCGKSTLHHRHTRHAFIPYQILVMHIKVTQLPLNVSRHAGQRRILVAFDGKVRLGARIGGRHYRARANGHFDQHFPGVFLVARQCFQLQRMKTHTIGMLVCQHYLPVCTQSTVSILWHVYGVPTQTRCVSLTSETKIRYVCIMHHL